MDIVMVVLLGVLTAVVATIGHSVHTTLQRSLGKLAIVQAELGQIHGELGRIRAELGTPQHAVYRLVAAPRMEAEGPSRPDKVPDRPNPA